MRAETGLHYNWHRHYDPAIGRFTQPDPIGLIDGPNRYAYVKNDPMQLVDPTGLWIGIDDTVTRPIDEIIIIGGLGMLAILGNDWAQGVLADKTPFTPNSKLQEASG